MNPLSYLVGSELGQASSLLGHLKCHGMTLIQCFEPKTLGYFIHDSENKPLCFFS